MTPKSAKAKGRNLQNKVAEEIRREFLLSKEDVKPAIMGEKGLDIHLSSAAKRVFPYGIECKNLNKIAVYKYYEQALSNAFKAGLVPVVVMKQNNSAPLVLIDFEYFLHLTSIKT